MGLRSAEWINLIAFAFFAGLALVRPMKPRGRLFVLSLAVAGGVLTWAGVSASQWWGRAAGETLRDWLPVGLILIPYWQGGQFARSPSAGLEQRFLEWDRRWLGRILESLRCRPFPAVFLETAYLLFYTLNPVALGILYLTRNRAYVDQFWLWVLPPTYLCYALLPFVQTRPPRSLAPEADPSLGRSMNLWLLDNLSIQVNTFPSCHVVASLAAAGALLAVLPAAGMLYLGAAASVAAAAVIGRYHYLADACAAAVLVGAHGVVIKALL